LVLGWALLASPGFWTLAVLGIVLIPALMTALLNLLRKARRCRWRTHLAAAVRVARQGSLQAVFTLVCLPYEAFYSLDAMLRTLWRLGVSQRGCSNGSCPLIWITRVGVSSPSTADVDQPRTGWPSPPWVWRSCKPAALLLGGRPHPAALVGLAGHRLVAQSAAGAPRGPA
jgi:hypothetical protein